MNQTGFRFISGYTDYQRRYIYCYTLMTQALSMENMKVFDRLGSERGSKERVKDQILLSL